MTAGTQAIKRHPGLRDSAGGLKEGREGPSLFTERKGPLLSQHHPENEDGAEISCPVSLPALFGLKNSSPTPNGHMRMPRGRQCPMSDMMAVCTCHIPELKT